MKLKTLKDFELASFYPGRREELKQEAIKWTKIMQKIDKGLIEMKKIPNVNAWIRMFFNITEEDLE